MWDIIYSKIWEADALCNAWNMTSDFSLARSLALSNLSLDSLSSAPSLPLTLSFAHTHAPVHAQKHAHQETHTHTHNPSWTHTYTHLHTHMQETLSLNYDVGLSAGLDPMAWAILTMIRDKISFVGVAHLTRGGRSCSWALYRCLSDKASTNKICPGTPWYRVAKTHRIPYLYRSFSAKEPYI